MAIASIGRVVELEPDRAAITAALEDLLHLVSGPSPCRLTATALSCRPQVKVPGPGRRPPGDSPPGPGGRRLGDLAGPGVAAGQLHCLVRRRQPRGLSLRRAAAARIEQRNPVLSPISS